MPNLSTSESANPVAPRPREGPEVMQAFVGRHRPFFLLVGLLLAQLLLLSFQITRNRNVRLIKVWTVAVFDPFERSLRGLSNLAAGTWRQYRDLWGAQQQNQELKIQLASARFQIEQLSQQAAESERLRVMLDLKNRIPLQTVAAEVIAASPGTSSSAVLIDKGSDSGLTPDLAVITPKGIVGKIITIFRHTAQVLLITDSSSGVGSLLEKSRIEAVLRGNGDVCRLNYVMNEESVTPGETVLTSGLDQIFPKGLPVGTVARVGEGNIYKNIEVKPAAELDRLETVLVVLKSAPTEQQATNFPTHH